MNRTYLVYKKQIRYRSDKLMDECLNLGDAEEVIDFLVEEMLDEVLLDVNSAEWQQMRAALYNAYYIRIMPEVQ